MEEADTLCTRIGIMAQGKMRSLGSSTELKTRHGQGYRLSLTLKRQDSELDEALLRNELCPTATLIYSFAKSRVYLLPTEGNYNLPASYSAVGPFGGDGNLCFMSILTVWALSLC